MHIGISGIRLTVRIKKFKREWAVILDAFIGKKQSIFCVQCFFVEFFAVRGHSTRVVANECTESCGVDDIRGYTEVFNAFVSD